jgi:bifunctional non-homologous end joining protein LigD
MPPKPERASNVRRLTFVEPMLAESRTTVPRGREWIYEAKLDGYRVQAAKEGRTVRLYSRRGHDLTASYPSVAAAVARIKARTAVLDGEVVAIDEEGRPSFQALQHRTSLPLPVVYYAFDLLHRDGRDLRSQPLEGRKGELAEVIDESGVYIPDSLPGALDDVIAALHDLRLEGIVAKRRHSVYRSARSDDWVKVKFLHRQELVIAAYKPGLGNFDSLVVGY